MSTATAPVEPKKADPHFIRHPLFPGNDCLWFPSGERDASEARICKMLSRENHYMVSLLELQVGENYRRLQVRHVDDPHRETSPRARRSTGGNHASGGAWDYAPGTVYAFDVPKAKRAPQPVAWPFDEPTGQSILLEARGSTTPGEIAARLAMPGVTKDIIAKFIAANT